MQRRDLILKASSTLAATAAALAVSPAEAQPASRMPRPDQRMAGKYRFDDPQMDLFFLAASGWGSSGGLEIGQAQFVASTIVDGDADSWVRSFSSYADSLSAQADAWLSSGCKRNAGETRLKAFASYRSAWQFAGTGEVFTKLYAQHHSAFVQSLSELNVAASAFHAPYAGQQLPGVFLPSQNTIAPVVLVIGGADTCFEDLFLTCGRRLLERGYSVALVDLPGQGITPSVGLHWEAQAELPIAAVIDTLIERFSAQPGRIALLGLSLGGYFVARAAGQERRVATVMASTPFPDPAQLFALSVRHAMDSGNAPTTAASRSYETTFWKAGAKTPEELVANTAAMKADPNLVTTPFLSILGGGDSALFAQQARSWHQRIHSKQKRLVELDASTGADAHVQAGNRLRLVQECDAWLQQLFGSRG